MASIICDRLKNKEFFASNWLERLRQIKRMRDKVPMCKKLAEKLATRSSDKPLDNDIWVTDFTEYS